MICVIGGRSKIGGALIMDLLAAGESVRALRRAQEHASFPAEVETVDGDLGDRHSLARAMAGAAKVFLLCGPTESEVELNCNAIDVAKQVGVELLVRSSIIGANSDSDATFVRDHGVCDHYLRESGVPHVIVRPNLFQQNIIETTIPSIGEDGKFYVNAGNARISMVDTRDVAAVAAAALTGSVAVGSSCDVTGPEALSYHDVASRIAATMGREVTYVDAPDDSVLATLKGFGLDGWMAGALVDLYQEYRRSGTNGYAASVSDTVQRLTGRAARPVDTLLGEQS